VSTLVLGLAMSLGLVAAPAQADGPGVGEPASAGLPLPLAQAGAYVGFGTLFGVTCGTDVGQWTLPEQLQGVALSEAVAANCTVTLFLTADGRVVSAGKNGHHQEDVPAAVASMDVVDLAASSSRAGVVAADGRVLVWGDSSAVPSELDVPVDLTKSAAPGAPKPVQLALGGTDGYALMSDGSVRAWGLNGELSPELSTGLTDVPAGLRARQVIATPYAVWALKTDGTVTGWGASYDNLPDYQRPPAITQEPGKVRAIASAGSKQYAALLDDGSVVYWGQPLPAYQPDLGGKAAVALFGAGGSGGLMVLDEDGVLHADSANFPDGLPQAQGLTPIVAASNAASGNVVLIVTRMLRAAPPTVTGTARVGAGPLSGTPGTFSDTPDQISSQWLVNGSPVGPPVTGDTSGTLALTGIPAGATIAYQSTATKAGQDPVTSTSVAVTVAAAPKLPPPTKVASKTKVSKIKAAKKAKKLTVTGKVTASKSPVGKATVTIKKGKKAIVTATVKVSTKGAWKLVVKKLGKKVAKKLHKKGKKAKTAYKGKYTVTIAYAGNAQVKPGKATKKFVVKK